MQEKRERRVLMVLGSVSNLAGACLSKSPRTEVVQHTNRSQAGMLCLDLPVIVYRKDTPKDSFIEAI